MKKLKIILIILLIFLGILSVYKFLILKKENIKVNNEYIEIKVKTEKKQFEDNGDYSNKYLDYKKSEDYQIIIDEKGIQGKIFIDDSNNIYIYEKINNKIKKISDDKFLTLKKYYNPLSSMAFFAISEKKDLYYIYLTTTNIEDIKIKKIQLNYTVDKFVNLYFNSPESLNEETFTVLSTDGKIYDVITGLMYNDKVVYLNGNYYVFEDNTVANPYGNMIKDENNKYVKIKYYIETWEDDKPFKKTNAIIITSDDKILYTNEDNDTSVNFYKEKIKKIKYTKDEKIFGNYNITIDFENGEQLNFKGLCFEGYYNLK